MPFFRRSKQSKPKPTELVNGGTPAPVRARYQSTWTSQVVLPEEIEELVHMVTAEMKLRAEALDTPFLLLPFRPSSDPSSARGFINTFFKSNASGASQYNGLSLQQELRLTDPSVLCSILKWCWSRMPKGVVSWPVYESFQLGEKEAGQARNAFDTFIPIGSDSSSRTRIIIDFFDLIAAVAAHGKLNGLGGRKLSRLAGWFAFEHSAGTGFEQGYKAWSQAADATSHLFFAYLRSLSPDVDPSMNVIERIPRSLQALLAQTEYPPQTPTLLQRTTPHVIMVVDQVSSSPFSLLRRAKHFEYRQNDRVLREYSEFDDPVDALTDECKRVLYAIASTNSGGVARSRHGMVKPNETWSSFTSTGFGDLNSEISPSPLATTNGTALGSNGGATPRSRNNDYNRPTTPSWGDFLSSGFQDEVSKSPSTMLLPPDKILPPIGSRTQTPSVMSGTDTIDEDVTPGELAAITSIELDDAFWWVWMTSLSGEEPNDRKAIFGRCALIETTILNGMWMIMEEQVKGASPEVLDGAQVVEKKSRFGFSRRNKVNRTKSIRQKQSAPPVPQLPEINTKANRMTLGADQQAKIKAAAAELSRKNDSPTVTSPRRGRQDDAATTKTNSMLTLGLQSEAGPAMKWASSYDKHAVRSAYLGSNLAGTGQAISTDSLARQQEAYSEPEAAAALPVQPPIAEERVLEEATPSPERVATPEHNAEHVPEHVDAGRVDHEPSQDYYNPTAKEIGLPAPTNHNLPAHPALRHQEDVSASPPETNPALIAARLALEGRAVSPESTKSSKFKKQPGGGGGLKKFFTRNKDKRRSRDFNPEGFNAASDAGPPRKLVPVRDEAASPVLSADPPHYEPEPVPEPEHELEPEQTAPVMPASHGHYNTSMAGLSRVDSEDQRDADDAFARFDQGPMDETPAAEPLDFVPYEGEEAAEPPTISRYSPRNPAPYTAPPPPADRFVQAHEHLDSIDDGQSEATMEDRREPAPIHVAAVDSSKDRWERIRENAARRAANARAGEDTSAASRPTGSSRTDDGETSGEETIESRVARIKARVAELTGNMDTSSSTTSLRR